MDYTYQCDGANCEHEVSVRHERGAGIFCEECSRRRIHLAFVPAAEVAEQERERNEQIRRVPQAD